MRLTRVYVDAELQPGSTVNLPRDTALHLTKVLRARNGDELILFNGHGQEFDGALEAVGASRVAASVGSPRTVSRESPFPITLIQSVPRGDRMDFIVQKATELGVARIVPVLSQRSVVRLDESQAESKVAHWRAVAVSACEQCGRNRLPQVEGPRPLLQYLGDLGSNSALRLVFDPDSDSREEGAAKPSPSAEVAIGPEGGYSEDELEAFRLAGFRRASLGPRVLRTETAAIAAVIWLQTRFGDMQAG
jgi:16S rRNA (uracil1498-N3)-methyltransferase